MERKVPFTPTGFEVAVVAVAGTTVELGWPGCVHIVCDVPAPQGLEEVVVPASVVQL